MGSFRIWAHRAIALLCSAVLACGGLLTAVGAANAAPFAITPQQASAQDEDENFGAHWQGRRFEAGQILVQFKPEATEADQAQILSQYNLTFVRQLLNLDTRLFSLEAGREQSIVDALNDHPLVEYAEPDYIFHAMDVDAPTLTPNDPMYGQQWGLAKINAPAAWDFTTGSSNVTIAVIDGGVELTHPDLSAKLTTGYNAIFNLGLPRDRDGHGTHVAGIAGASSNNGVGTAGVAWGARIIPVKALTPFGGRSSDIAEAVGWASNAGADIINMSLGSTADSTTLRNAIQLAYYNGVFMVAAMGNEFQYGSPTNYPAAYPEVMAVAATDINDQHASFSNRGAHVEVSAPGVDIWSTYRTPSGATYAPLSGTSMSSPYVAGLAALLLSLNPALTPDQVRGIIIISATDIGTPGWDDLTGWGRIDALTAVALLLGGFSSSTAAPQANDEVAEVADVITDETDAAELDTVELDSGLYLPIAVQ